MEEKGKISVDSPSEYLERYKEGYKPSDIVIDDFFSGDLVSFLEEESKTDEDALLLLGDAYYRGIGCEEDDEKAFKIFYPLATKGVVYAEKLLASFYLHTGEEEQKARADYWFNKAAESGDVDSLLIMGAAYLDDDNPSKDIAKGLSYFEEASKKGNPRAAFILGCYYYTGLKVEKDSAKAFSYFSLSSKEGYPDATAQLGICYFNGEGIGKDEVRAVELFKEATDKGSDIGMLHLGICYEKGAGGLPKDHSVRNKWWMKASDLGNARSSYLMGVVYTDGDYVNADKSKAFSYFLKAADLGYTEAEFEAGKCLMEGIGCGINEEKGRYYIEKAAHEGYLEASHYVGDHIYRFPIHKD